MATHVESVQHSEQLASGHVAANTRAEMARRKIRQRHIAEYLGMTQQSVSARLSGRVAFTVDELAAIARLLGVDPATLLVPASARGQRSAS